MPEKFAERPKILVFSDFYLPGYKSGGGMRTVVNMIERLGDRYDFCVVTRDHDGNLDRAPYENVKIDDWNDGDFRTRVFYVSKDNIRFKTLRRLILDAAPAVIYTNSFFAAQTGLILILRKAGLIPNLPVVLAPCGELSERAMRIKSVKKKVFIPLAKTLDLYRNLIWKASSDAEKAEIETVKPARSGALFVAPDMLPATILPDFDAAQKPKKISGAAKMIFLARFVRIKNFKWLLELLPQTTGNLEIDVWGPIEDADYWRECEEIIKTLPPNVKISAKGSIPHQEAARKMLDYHFFISPTLSENFGHVFVEALAAGCPLVISDRTPWTNLEAKKIGRDVPLDAPEEWIKTLDRFVKLNADEYSELSSNARRFAVRLLEDGSVAEDTIKILDYALNQTTRRR